MPYKLIDLLTFKDERGYLVPLEKKRNLPFDLKGAFFVTNFPKGLRRGKHAHTKITQFIVVLNGSIRLKIYDKFGEHYIFLNNPFQGLIIYPYTWIEIESLCNNTIFLVCIDDLYDETEVIRDFETFKELINEI